MGEGEAGQHLVLLRVDGKSDARVINLGDQIFVGEFHALGNPGAAGGVDERGRVVFIYGVVQLFPFIRICSHSAFACGQQGIPGNATPDLEIFVVNNDPFHVTAKGMEGVILTFGSDQKEAHGGILNFIFQIFR